MQFQPSQPHHYMARRNETEKAWYEKPLWDSFTEWWNTPSLPAPETYKPGQPTGPATPDGTAVAKGSKPYNAILEEINKKYGEIKALWRDVSGDGNYTYRQYIDGRIFIQKPGKGKTPTPPKKEEGDPAPVVSGPPPWVLPVAIVGGAALIGAGIYFWPKIRAKMRR